MSLIAALTAIKKGRHASLKSRQFFCNLIFKKRSICFAQHKMPPSPEENSWPRAEKLEKYFDNCVGDTVSISLSNYVDNDVLSTGIELTC